MRGDAGDELLAWSGSAGPVRVATLDVGLSKTPRPDARFVLGIDQPLYLSIHSGVSDVAPAGGTMLHVAKYLGDDASSADEVERELEALLDLAQPGWRDVLVERRFLPNLIAVNALVKADDGGLAARPSPATAHAGGSPAGGIPSSLEIPFSYASAHLRCLTTANSSISSRLRLDTSATFCAVCVIETIGGESRM